MRSTQRSKVNHILLWAIIVIRVFIFEPYIVPSESMSRTMENGDIVLATKWNFGFSRMSIPFVGGFLPFMKKRIMAKDPNRGDVICFSLDRQPGKLYTKRIIGIAGDKIRVSQGQIHINDKPLSMKYKEDYTLTHDNGQSEIMEVFQISIPKNNSSDDYVTYEVLRRKAENISQYNHMADNTTSFSVPEGHAFCIGDNMHFSTDFRFYQFASSISYDRIIGKPKFIIFGSKSRVIPEENWLKWIVRLPYSIMMSLLKVNWSRIGRSI